MDLKRNILIAGLAVVSYLLLLAWNEDSQQLTAANNGRMAASDLPTPVATADLPRQDSSDSDLPQVQDAAPAITESPAPSRELIRVRTPVHDLRIDPLGGDIVDLTLPQYPVSLDAPDVPFQLLRPGFVSRSGLVGRNGPDQILPERPVYQSAQTQYQLESGQLDVDLLYTSPEGVEIIKRFTFSADDYLIQVQYLINNQGAENWTANLFGQVRRDGAPDPSSIDGFGVGDYIGPVLTTPDDPYKRVTFRDLDRNRGTTDTVEGGWIGFSQRYFLSSWIPDQQQTHTYTTRRNAAGEYLMEFVSPATTIAPGSNGVIAAAFWAGPKHQYRLDEIAPNLNLTVDYGWLWFIAQPLFWLLMQINNIIGNWGWSIIVLTLVIKVLFMKLSAASYRSMAKMRRLTPKVNQLKDRYGDDKQKLMQAQMELWKKEKVNPLGGCLPMLLQMPVLIGIYWVLSKAVELRQAEFIFWYNDLSAMDPYFILPLIMGASMYVSQTMMPITTADPMQAKILRFMPVVFTIFFLWFPSGLVLYWLVSNVFNIVQQYFVNKQVDALYKKKAA